MDEISCLSLEFEQRSLQEILDWTVREFGDEHQNRLPSYPLLAKGCRSIGCTACTVAVGESESDRAGRRAGRGKTECGLHTEMFRQKEWDGR